MESQNWIWELGTLSRKYLKLYSEYQVIKVNVVITYVSEKMPLHYTGPIVYWNAVQATALALSNVNYVRSNCLYAI